MDPAAQVSTIAVLLELKNVHGGTVLDSTVWASRHAGIDVDHVPVVEQLVAAGANVDAVSPFPSGDDRIDAALRGARSEVDPDSPA